MNKKTIYLKDYLPPAWLIPETELRVTLAPEDTQVEAILHCKRNPQSKEPNAAIVLNGERLQLERLALNGRDLAAREYGYAEGLLSIPVQADECTIASTVRINPAANLELDGLYRSAGNYCTQCEAEGFRKITFFPDRPDVMSVFTTTVIGEKRACPVLLANGNLREQGELAGGLHFATWHDPFPKPCYLFALVAGNLVALEDSFTTKSGRRVALAIYVEPRNAGKCGHAMAALKTAMRWDEERFGREYDLDNFKILAVDDFNMGAMENKGLNVFNSKYVLALPETATDTDFDNIGGVIAHEYFHNWTGNRVTCRDWFQLSLKEGLTVFRDQEFSSDIASRPVKRIRDVNLIRSIQFREDAGPMAHPVRPASFVEINNFYTATVYDKGAELIRMMHTLLGEAGFRRGMDLYFERHDGQAVTCDDFVAALADANHHDFTQFKRWYSQAGTPELFVTSRYDAAGGRLLLRLRQSCPATPDMAEKKPFVIPLALGLLARDGRELSFSHAGRKNPAFLTITQKEQDFVLDEVAEEPVLSLLRNFSAPVKLHFDQSDEELSLRLGYDRDPWGRWDAGQHLALKALMQGIEQFRQGHQNITLPDTLKHGMAALLDDERADAAFRAVSLVLPTENWIGQQMAPLDPEAVFWVRQRLRALLGQELRPAFLRHYEALGKAAHRPYVYTTAEAGRRALRNMCLDYLLCCAPEAPADADMLALGERQYREADNMTDGLAALSAVVNADRERGDALLQDFLAKWQTDPLVMDKWLSLQAACPLPGTLARVRALLRHPVFDLKNPNKVRALVASFCALNQRQFHARDGAGYEFLKAMVAKIDRFNPQIATRMAAPFTQWRRYDADRQQGMRAQLEELLQAEDISDDLKELLEKSLWEG